MKNGTAPTYDFGADVRRETEWGYLLLLPNGRLLWGPKTLTSRHSDGTFSVPKWYAEQAGIM